jgi:ABC-2 type transport system permease protein
MVRALLYLRVMSLIGLMTSRIRRLRQPKYLSGAVVGVAYIYLIYFRRAARPLSAHRPGPPVPNLPPETFTIFVDLAALALLVVLVVNWAIPRPASLTFSEAEIAFLFPAPVSRRLLIHYRLLGSQLGIALTALIFTVALRRGVPSAGNVSFHAIGWWLILFTLNLHFIGTSFVYSKLMNRSLTTARERATRIGVVSIVVLALIVWAASTLRLPQSGDTGSASEFLKYLALQLHAGPFPWLLAIPRLVVAPYFATTGRAFLLALGFALIILIAHYIWVMYIQVSFEEASIARAEKRAARREAAQRGDWRGQAAHKAQRSPFELRDSGRPEVAFLWKNLFSGGPIARPRTAIILALLALGGCDWLVQRPDLEPMRVFFGTIVGSFLGILLFVGSMMTRQDLRTDLPNTDILKTYPLHGWQVVLGELLAPLATLSTIIWSLMLAEFLLFPANTLTWFDPTLRGAVALSGALIAPPLLAIQLLVLNAAVLIFPAWTQSAGNRAARGIEVLGERIIFVAGLFLITTIALIPAAIGATFIFLVAKWLAGVLAAIILAAIAVVLVLSVEAWLGILWLGDRFERFDLSAELRP